MVTSPPRSFGSMIRPGVLAVRFARLLHSEVLIVDARTHLDDGARRCLVDGCLNRLVDAIDGSVSNLLVDNECRLHSSKEERLTR